MTQGGGGGQVVLYQITQNQPINPELFNLFRALSVDPSHSTNDFDGFVNAQNEDERSARVDYATENRAILTLINAYADMIKEDGRLITELGSKVKNIQSEPDYMASDTKRRQVMSLETAISNKQTFQIANIAAAKKGIDFLQTALFQGLGYTKSSFPNLFFFN